MADAQIKITADTSQAERALGTLNSSIKALAAVAIGGSLFKFVDDLQNMQNKLRVATKDNDDFQKSLAFVKAIADSTGQSMNAIGDVYSKVSANADKLHYSTDQVATTTYAMALALKASGASAEGSASTMYQFGQILNKGKLNGDEFTTMTENLSGNVLSKLITNMGITRAEFETFKSKGLVGAKNFTDALIKSVSELDAMQGKTLPTLGQSLQRIQNAFADFTIKLDKATGITNALANGMTYLANNVDKVLPIIAALVGYFAAARLLAAAVALFEIVKGIRAIGIAAAVTEALATGGISAITGLAGAAAAYAGASIMFDKVDESIKQTNVDLNATADAAKKGLGETNLQLTGVGEKLTEILKDLDKQIALGVMNAQQFEIENEILSRNKDLGYQMTEAQKSELRIRLQKLQVLKEERSIVDIIRQNTADINALNTIGTIALRTQQQIEKYRLDTGKEMSEKAKEDLFNSNKQLAVNTELRKLRDDLRGSMAAVVEYQKNITINSVDELEARMQVLQIERELGTKLSMQQIANVAVTIEKKKQLEYLRQIKQATQDFSTPLTGPAAGANAASQLGNLDPLQAAKTANQSLFAGLEYLRQNDLISEQTYQTARVSAEVQANAAILSANQRLAEDRLKLAGVTNQAIIDSVKAQQANVMMIQQGGVAGFQGMLGAIDNVMASMATQNRKAFEAHKALATAQAIISTYQAAAEAIAFPPGPPLSFIYVAGAIAAGMAQVSAIQSQQYSGRAVGGSVMGNNPYIVGEKGPELFTPASSGMITPNDKLSSGQAVNINFNIQANDAQGFDQLLVQRRSMVTQMVRDAMAENGQRMKI